jgi:hypothetical protein
MRSQSGTCMPPQRDVVGKRWDPPVPAPACLVARDGAHGDTDRCNIACASPKNTAYRWKGTVGERRREPVAG